MAVRSLGGASIVVTGATGGIGRQIATQLAQRGARLTLNARDATAIAALGIDATVIAADLRDATSGNAIVEAALAAHGRLDGIVNAAGIVAFGSLLETNDVVIEDLFLTNVLGPLWLIRAALPALTEAGSVALAQRRVSQGGWRDEASPFTSDPRSSQLSVQGLSVPTGDHRPRRALVSAVRALLPRRRRTAR